MAAKKKKADELGGNLVELGNEEAWLKYRLSVISGTDAGVIARTSKYQSRHGLWLKKTGRIVEDRTFPEDPHERYGPAYWGTVLEDDIRNTFVEDKGLKVVTDPEWSTRIHPDYDWMSGSLDGHVFDPDRGWGVFEAKTAGLWKEDEWSNGRIPKPYLVQVMHYMAVTGYTFAWFAVLIGGQKYKTFLIERIDSFIDALIKAEEDFHKHIVDDVPVEMDGHKEEADVLGKMFPVDDGATVELPKEALEWDAKRLEAIEAERASKELRAQSENKIKDCIGDAAYGVLPDGVGRYSWKGKNRRLLRQEIK